MKRKHYGYILISLCVCLFIYMFFRTTDTVVNKLIAAISFRTYMESRLYMVSHYQLADWIVFSLPEALWIFSLTLTSWRLYFKIGGFTIHLGYLPIVFCVMLELMQLLAITNGRFDFIDIGASVIAWMGGVLISGWNKREPQSVMPFTAQGFSFLTTFTIVLLAHVDR